MLLHTVAVELPLVCRYRCIFPNDEDLTSNHRADPLGRNVFDLAAWDVFFATALRMKVRLTLATRLG